MVRHAFVLLTRAIVGLAAGSALLMLCSAAGSFTILHKVQLEGAIVRARMLDSRLICATQGTAGRLAFFDASEGEVSYHLSESGATRRFHPTLLAALAGRAIVLDEAYERCEFFGSDGNSTAKCVLAPEVLAVPFGSPVDVLPAGKTFSEGFLILTERGYFLTVEKEGQLAAQLDLRQIFNRPEAFFARAGRTTGGDEFFAFSPNTGCIFIFSRNGDPQPPIQLDELLSGDAQVSDAVMLDDGSLLVTQGKELFHVLGERVTSIPVESGFTSAGPLFVDSWGSRVLIYHHNGEMIVGELK